MIGTVTGFIAFALARGVVVTDAQAGVAPTKAADYLDGKDWEGSASEDSAWARTGLCASRTTLLHSAGVRRVGEEGRSGLSPAH